MNHYAICVGREGDLTTKKKLFFVCLPNRDMDFLSDIGLSAPLSAPDVDNLCNKLKQKHHNHGYIT